VLSDELQTALFGYLARLDDHLSGVVTGLYVVGSAALGDFQDRTSNLDLVVTADRPWAPDELRTAVAAHPGLGRGRGRPACVAYVTTDDLGADPRGLDRPVFEGSAPVAADRLINPFTWQLLGSGAVDLRGPDHPVLWDDPDAVRSWAAGRLSAGWSGAGARPGAWWLRRTVSGTVLEAARLAVAASGSVVSKVEASRVVRDRVPGRFRRILEDSAGYRMGGRSSMYWGPMERKRDARDLVRELVAASAAAGPCAA
jgi:hypothetical protein